MFHRNRFTARTVAISCIALVISLGRGNPDVFAGKVSVDGKVVLANVSKHTASFRLAKVKKDIAPRKASLLSPKQFPITIDVWNGKKGQPAWVPQAIEAAGVYTFNYQNGEWKLSKHQKTASKPTTTSAPKKTSAKTTTPSTTARRPSVRQPSYRRTTGSTPRVVRGSGRVYRGSRVPILRRISGSLLGLYRFIRDEEDRDLIRDIIIGREIDEEIERELWDRLDDVAVNLPILERREFERDLRDLRNLEERDLRDLEDATDDEWDLVRDEFGDQVADNAWREIESDYDDIDVDTLPVEEIDTLDEVGIDSLESNIDLGDLEGGEVAIDDFAGTLDDVDTGDLGGGIEDIDIGDLGADFGNTVGQDIGGDLGLGGGLQNPLGDLAPGGGAGMNYDTGGFDDYGGNMGGGDLGGGNMGGGDLGGGDFGGGDFGGGDFGGGDFGGGDFGGGDFGGGDFGGGDLGGGFDDFGGGGFDDFGGGDFGGGDFDF